uniref:LOB domain-containing protein n=1 Tax=Quercus lobata TaxID=97700 RepID=A0A7N2RCA8_QUELO
MVGSIDTNTSTTSSTPISHSPPSPSSPPPPPVAFVKDPCAACNIFRRTCAEKCPLAPYFPCTEPAKVTTAHRSFGASNTINFFQTQECIEFNCPRNENASTCFICINHSISTTNA